MVTDTEYIDPPPLKRSPTNGPYSVIICDACGKGFLRWSGSGIDIMPPWSILSSKDEPGICGGALRMISRPAAIEIADRYEKIGSEKWLSGQRKP